MLNTDTSLSKPSIRLKELVIAAAVAGAVMLWLAPSAKAASDAVCENYASSAVRQQGINLAESCGFTGFRWHAWREGHYSWCKGVSNARANRGTRRRANDLDHCHDDF